MASAMAAEGFLELTPVGLSSCWLNPKISFSRDLNDEEKLQTEDQSSPPINEADPEESSTADFEFRRLDDSVGMLPADELFSEGKLVPLHRASFQSKPGPSTAVTAPVREMLMKVESDPRSLYSPKAPRCSSRLRQLLGLKKKSPDNIYLGKTEAITPKPPPSNKSSIRQLLNRSQKSSLTDSYLSIPLLKDCNADSLTMSARTSLSDKEELPRLSLDSSKSSRGKNLAKVRLKPSIEPSLKCNQVLDSPRMNSSGKVVFHGLERSSSSPGSFNGGPRVKHRGVERSYSANIVRAPSVLNVPLCSKASSIFGFVAPRNSNSGRTAKIVRGTLHC